MTTMNISLPEQVKEFIEQHAQREGFSSVSDYLCVIIREIEKRAAKQDLEAKLVEGLRSGPSVALTSEEWDAIEREGLQNALLEQQAK